MALPENVGGRDRLGRAALAVLFSIAALSALRSGNRSRAVLATVAALGFGFNATTCFCGLNAALGLDTTAD
jgi:hypothetical protein